MNLNCGTYLAVSLDLLMVLVHTERVSTEISSSFAIKRANTSENFSPVHKDKGTRLAQENKPLFTALKKQNPITLSYKHIVISNG